MKKKQVNWKGCFTAIITPFKENGDLDRDAFSRNIDLLIREGLEGVMVLPPPMLHLSDQEHFAFFKAVSDSIDLPILVYNNPYRQGVDLLPEFLLKIAELDNFVCRLLLEKKNGTPWTQ